MNQGPTIDWDKIEDSSDESEDDLEINESGEQSADHEKTVEIINPDGSTKIIRKSTLVWLLVEENHKLSADRLKRVQSGNDDGNSKKQKRISQALFPEGTLLVKFDIITIGHWCFFELFSSELERELEQNVLGNIVLGRIVGFRYANAKNNRERKCNYESVDISKENQSNSSLEIETLATWYTCDGNGVLTAIEPNNHFFINLKHYVGTTSVPVCKQETECSKINLVLKANISNLLSLLHSHTQP